MAKIIKLQTAARMIMYDDMITRFDYHFRYKIRVWFCIMFVMSKVILIFVAVCDWYYIPQYSFYLKI